MPTVVLATIQSYIDANHTITAHHNTKDCSHYAQLDLIALAKKLGPDYSIPDNHDAFVSQLVCSACGKKGAMSLIISPPRK